ncbi:DUF92 domain-containing protein [Pontibacter sp. G13]|uniref:DUF92 domain-containing protein n=1 Tax=Pontibacter sp. G13 TaxID=3074898 RepID=UPI00288B6612|nr:DUF92 domain-containing protein [Pontibacter sp. G13]WNJ16695.1 DUF92 domain-containing protein [Pontibacter sp. G13]
MNSFSKQWALLLPIWAPLILLNYLPSFWLSASTLAFLAILLGFRWNTQSLRLGIFEIVSSLASLSVIGLFQPAWWGFSLVTGTCLSFAGMISTGMPHPSARPLGWLIQWAGAICGVCWLVSFDSNIQQLLSIRELIIVALISSSIGYGIGRLNGIISKPLAMSWSASATFVWGYYALSSGSFFFPIQFPWVILLMVLFVIASIASGKIDLPGAIVGGWIGMGMFLGGGWPALALLFLFFVMGTGASSWKKRSKESLGLEQELGGKRSVRHAFANGGTAMICGFTAWVFPEQAQIWEVMLACSIASAAGDTWSSELGNILGKSFWDLRNGKRGQRGLDGVISLEGSLVGYLASAIIAVAYCGLSGEWAYCGIVIGAGIIGNLADSLLGASLQRNGLMTNDTVNFANTLIAAMAGGIFFSIFL